MEFDWLGVTFIGEAVPNSAEVDAAYRNFRELQLTSAKTALAEWLEERGLGAGNGRHRPPKD